MNIYYQLPDPRSQNYSHIFRVLLFKIYSVLIFSSNRFIHGWTFYFHGSLGNTLREKLVLLEQEMNVLEKEKAAYQVIIVCVVQLCAFVTFRVCGKRRLS